MNILLTSSGRRSYLVSYFKRALEGQGLVHAANSFPSTALAVADQSVITPLIYDENYINFLLDYCTDNEIHAVISLFDIDLPVLANSASEFMSRGIKVVVSDPGVITICNDKWATYRFSVKNGIHMPRTYLSLRLAFDSLSENKLVFPLVVKPRWGMGSIGLYEVAEKEELEFFYNKVKKNIQDSYLFYESKIDIENSVLIQEKLNGQEYGLDVVNSLEGEFATTFVKKKLAMRSGETDIAATEENEILFEFGRKLSTKLSHVGILDVDVFVVDEKVYLLEMNNRFGGGYPFSHIAGANIPLAYIHWLEKRNPPEFCFSFSYGITGMKDTNILKTNNVPRQ